MIRFSVFLWLSLLSIISVSQVLPDGVLLKEGSEFSTSGKREIKKILGVKDGGFIAYTREGNDFEFLLFDDNLVLKRSNKEVLRSGKKQLQFVKMVETKSGIYVFSGFQDGFLKREVLYYQELNQEFLTLSMAKILHSKGYNEGGGQVSFFIETSENKEYLMVDVTSGKSSDTDDFGFESFDVLVFDSQFDKVWREDEIELSDEEERMFRDDRLITNEGKVIMMSLSILGDFEDLDISDDVYSMFNYNVVVVSEGKEHVLYELKSESGYFADLNYRIADNGNLHVVGVSFDKKEEERSWYYSVLDLDSGVFVVEHKSDFEETQGVVFNMDDTEDELVELIKTSPYSQSASTFTPNLLLGDIFIGEEGTTVTFQSNVTASEYYQKRKIIVGAGAVRFNEQGEQTWVQSVRKIQFSNYESSKFLSSGVINSEGNISFVFNFKPMKQTHGNLNTHVWDAKNESDLYIATIDNYGDLNVNVLLEGSKKPFWVPAYEFPFSNNGIIFFGSSGKKSKLVKLSINK